MTTFKRPSKSCALILCTEIIKQLIGVQDLDPMVHFMKEGDHGDPEEEEKAVDDQGDDVDEEESDESKEEEEPQPGPSKKRKVEKQKTSITGVQSFARVQQKENEHNLALATQKNNIEDMKEGNANLEEGELSDSS